MDNSFPPAVGRVNVPDKHFGKFVSVLSKNFLSAWPTKTTYDVIYNPNFKKRVFKKYVEVLLNMLEIFMSMD